jgi:hypothetical protein
MFICATLNRPQAGDLPSLKRRRGWRGKAPASLVVDLLLQSSWIR